MAAVVMAVIMLQLQPLLSASEHPSARVVVTNMQGHANSVVGAFFHVNHDTRSNPVCIYGLITYSYFAFISVSAMRSEGIKKGVIWVFSCRRTSHHCACGNGGHGANH